MTEKQEVLSDLLLISTTVKAAIITLFYVLYKLEFVTTLNFVS
ncbi:hypothetical protein ANACAC_01946 [Anaerostipes caccae L1-92]|uniref:Uncharacterized protein n=1 Tax=Anaerostipes caccae (strain DSM 14662 / CCUG 47493 / JCM 13470 / NCIMB 13811 / L1-92) TaxID=411490 RepID=B0MEF1_ANACD|nr:hypothetical protein ANACAC_01946 [Anaerostipes caccae L1-92]